MRTHTRRRAYRENCASLLQELPQLRNRLRHRDRAHALTKLRRDVFGIRRSIERILAPAASAPCVARGNAAAQEDEHIKLAREITRIERLRIDDSERKLEPFH